MKKKKIPMRKCIITNGTRPRKNMIRVVVNKEGEIFADGTGKQQGRGAYILKDVRGTKDVQKDSVLEKYFNENPEKLNPVYKEVIRLICREEIPR